MNYTLSPTRSGSRFISIIADFDAEGREEMEIQLAAWRPGRYEIGNFAKNIRKFEVLGEDGENLPCKKVTKDRWLVTCQGKKRVHVKYEYFAANLDAGSTFCGKKLLYINPVNCLVFDPARAEKPCEIILNVPDTYLIASSMRNEGTRLYASGYEELADSPIIASPDLEHHNFAVDDHLFHIWIQGHHRLNIPRFIEQAKAYTREQIQIFGEMESPEFHYLFLFLPTRFHHGVEHHASTVIAMGPGDEFHTPDRHQEFMAICSHELFHYWNVKRIRPAEMFPYSFTGENYSRLGYVYEGITTYYGDYTLLRSGVWSHHEYLKQFNSDLQKHYDNEGRHNYSVADSSFDTWLDGYVPGVPGRKVSIYTEGMLAAFMLDLEIRYTTQNERSLDTVMNRLYHDFYKKGLPYTEQNFQEIIEKIAGKSFAYFFTDFYNGKGNIEKFLPESLWSIGCEIQDEASSILHESRYGFKLSGGPKVLVTAILEDSPAEKSGLSLNDEIILINNTPASPGTDWNQLFTMGSTMLVWNSIEGSKMIEMVAKGESYFRKYSVKKMEAVTEEQKAFFKHWSGQEF